MAELILQTLFWLQENQRLWLLGFVVMPDHLHVVLAPRAPHQLHTVTQNLFSYTARQINAHLHRQGALWAEEYYEHLLASREKVQPCLDYLSKSCPEKVGIPSRRLALLQSASRLS